MAIVHAIPELWSAGLLRGFDAQAVWAALSTDYSGEFAGGGDTLHLNEVMGTINVRNYVAGTPLEAVDTPDDSDLTLVIDQAKYFNIAVEDIERFQARPPVFEEWTRQAGQRIANTFDRYLYGIFNANWDDAGGDRTRFTYAKLPGSGATKAWREGLVDSVQSAVQTMDNRDWPSEGRWLVMPTAVKFHILDYLRKDLGTIGTGVLADAALQEAAFSNLFGVTTRVDNQMPDPEAAANNPYFLMGRTDAVGYARQISKVEAYRPERAFQDAIKGLFVYGSTLIYPDRRIAVVRGA